MTGQSLLNRHVTLTPLCLLGVEDQDTSLHLLGRCNVVNEKQTKYFRRYFVDPSKLRPEH